MEKEEAILFCEQLKTVLLGGEEARSVIRGDNSAPFDEWLDTDAAERAVVTGLLKSISGFVDRVGSFADQKEDQKLQVDALFLLNQMGLCPATANAHVLTVAQKALIAKNFRSRMYGAGIIADLRNEKFFAKARRVLVDILANNEFDDWLAVEVAAESYRSLGGSPDQDARLKELVELWEDLPKRDCELNQPRARRVWEYAAIAADYLGLREEGNGSWWDFERDCRAK